MKHDNWQAYREGWALFEDNAIQRLDDPQGTGLPDMPANPVFRNDAEAVAFVMEKARRGSVYHRRAIRLAARIDS